MISKHSRGRMALIAGLGLLVAGLMVATLLPAGATTAAKVVPRTLEQMSIPAAAFVPANDNLDYINSGFITRVDSGGSGTLVAPVYFPHPVVVVRKVYIYVTDNDPSNDTCVTLYRSVIAAGDVDEMVEVCSTGWSTTAPREFEESSFSPRRLLMAHAPYLELVQPAGGDTNFWGVRIVYGY